MACGRREPAAPGAHLARTFLLRVQLGGRALPRHGRAGWFDSIHANEVMPPFHGWNAVLRTLTAKVQVLPAVPPTTHGLRSGTSLVSKTGRAGFDPSAACECLGSSIGRASTDFSFFVRLRAGGRSLPIANWRMQVRILSGAPLHALHAPLAQQLSAGPTRRR